MTSCSTGIGLVLRLLEQFDQAGAAIELLLRGFVQFGSELGEGFEFAVGGQVELQRAGDFFHRLGLGVAADAADADADVDGGADAGEEQFGLEIDLAVGDADDVGRDVGRDFAFLGFDDRQGGEADRRRFRR